MKKRWIGLLVLILMLGLLFTGCGSQDAGGKTDSGEGSTSQDTESIHGSNDPIETDDSNALNDVDVVNDSDVTDESNVTEESGGQVTEEPEAGISEESDTGISEDENTEETVDMTDKAPTLLYQGHGSVRITTADGKVIYVDPFAGKGYDETADLILITHGHADHTRTDLITSQSSDCETITYKEALEGGEHQSFDLGYIQIEAVEAYNSNHKASECVGYVLTFENGIKLYLSGDTSTTDQMSEMADMKLDYAFFCCDGVYNMNVQEASQCSKTVNAKHNIPYHMLPSNQDIFDKDVAGAFDAPGKIILEPGDELVLE